MNKSESKYYNTALLMDEALLLLLEKKEYEFITVKEICQKENIDLIIDDDYRVIEKLSSNNIKTLYFRDGGMKELEENEYIKEVNNWGDIYRIINRSL